MPEKFRLLWEQLSGLWVCIALNPTVSVTERQKCRQLLLNWSQLTFCPLEDANFRVQSDSLKRKLNADLSSSDDDEAADQDEAGQENHEAETDDEPDPIEAAVQQQGRARIKRRTRQKKQKVVRTIFQRALEASQLTWDDPHLCAILDGKYERTCDRKSFSCCSEAPFSDSFEGMHVNRSKSPTSYCDRESNQPPTQSVSSLSASASFNSQGCPLWNGMKFKYTKSRLSSFRYSIYGFLFFYFCVYDRTDTNCLCSS